MKKAAKSFFVQNLTEELKSATSVILIDYAGLSVKAQQELKKKLKEVKSKMLVTKNTLFKLAATSAKTPKEALADTVLAGPTALILAQDDPIAPLQVLHKFAKEHNLPQLKVGIIEGSFQDKDSLLKLAKLPGKDALYAQVVGTIGSPLYGLVSVLNANLGNLLYVLKQASKGK